MSEYLGPDHPRKAAAVKFGKELSRAIAASGATKQDLARTTGHREALIWAWTKGNHLPRIESAQKLASALNAPKLVQICVEGRKTNCVECGKVLVQASGPMKRYCSSRCQNIQFKLRNAKGTPRERVVSAERQLAIYSNAVHEMCFTCEPEGMCRDDGCSLRVVSPLPVMVYESDSEMVQPTEVDRYRKRWQSAEERRKQAERSREYWSTRTAEEKKKHMDKAREVRWGKTKTA